MAKGILFRFWSKVNKKGPTPAHRPELGPCWIWMAFVDDKGYGRFGNGKKIVKAHRFSYELIKEIPDGLMLDHLCRTRNCVNPNHLEPVTAQENTTAPGSQSGAALAERNRSKTACPKGHPYDEKNTYINSQGDRLCRECNRLRAEQRRQDARN